MKNLSLLLLAIVITNSNAWAGDVANAEKFCGNKAIIKSNDSSHPSIETTDKRFPGNTFKCQEMTRGHMKQLYKNGSRTDHLSDWLPYLYLSCKDQCSAYADKKTAAPTVTPNEELETLDTCIKKVKKTARQCESLAYVISRAGHEWAEPYVSEDAKGTSFPSSGITCKSDGVETLDYEACVNFGQKFDTLEIVQKTAYQGQELVYQSKAMDHQAKAASSGNSATGALEATKDSVKDQQSMYNQRSAVDAGKLAILYNDYKDFPNVDTLKGYCNGFADRAPKELEATPESCIEAVRPATSVFGTLKNQSQLDKMKAKMIQVATSAGANLLLASLLGKRVDDLNNAIAKVNDFKPIDPVNIDQQQDLQTTLCAQNPGAQECLTGNLERTFDTMGDNVITFGEGGLGTSFVNPNTSQGGTTAVSETATTKRESVGSVGSAIKAAAQDNSMEQSSGAKVTQGGSPGGGPGGGGPAGSGGVGGSGGGLPQAPAQGGTQAAVQGKTPSYGGGGGSLSMMGGLGIRSKAGGKAEDNPFGKLFDKGKKDGSGVLNFRDIASTKVGGKNENIFDMISKRYSSVSADKRLIEYEEAK